MATFEQVVEDLRNMRPGRKGNGESPNDKGFGAVQWLVVIGLFVAYGVATAFYKVDTTEKAVITRFGAFHALADEGPHFKLPFGIDEIYKVEVTRVHEELFGKRSGSSISAEQFRTESIMLTGDLKVAIVEWSLQYRIHDPRKFLFNAVKVDKNIRDISISVMRRVVGDKLVTDVLTTDRVAIAEAAKRLTQETLDRFDMGVTLSNLSLQTVAPPEKVRAAFNEVNIAKQEADQLINQARGRYNKIIPEARGKADQQINGARAYSIARVNQAMGNAERFRKVLTTYKESPRVTARRMYLEAVDAMLAAGTQLTIVDRDLGGLLPIFGGLSRTPPTLSDARPSSPEAQPGQP